TGRVRGGAMELGRAIIFAKDMAVMRAFYGEALGLAPIAETSTPDWAEFAAGGMSLALHAIPREVAQAIVVSSPSRARDDVPVKLVFWVDDVRAEHARLLARGVSMREPQPWGACDGVDPEGNVFQIAQRRR